MKEKLFIGVFCVCYLLAIGADGQDDLQAEYNQHPASHYVAQLSDDDAEVRRRAAYVLGRMGAPAEVAVPALAKALSDRQMETRWYAIDALGQFESQAAPAVPDIVKSLQSTLNDKTVRRRGARTLGRIGKAAGDAVPTLEEALESEDSLYRVAAAAALWRIDGKENRLSVIAKELGDDEAQTAFYAAMVIAELPTEGQLALLDQLVNSLKHADADVRQAAVNAIVSIGPPAIEPLSTAITSLPKMGRVDAARALGMIIDQQRKQALYSETASEREFAAAAGPMIRTAFPALANGMASGDEELRATCSLALAKGGSAAVLQLLKDLQLQDADRQKTAGQALARVEAYLPKQRPLPDNIARVHARIVESLVLTLANDDPGVQRAGVRLFVALQIGPEGAAAKPHLQRALQTGDLATRRFADKALKQIEKPPQ